MTNVLVADCLIAMAMLGAESVDAIVTDPPYGLRFMGKAWDHGVPGVPFWSAALRLLKPGARLLAFGGTRTYHRLACAIEDAGFEIEDSLCWLYGSGFPKHESKLKPAFEPVVMARRPSKKATLLNIDACRLSGEGLHEVTQGAQDRVYGNGNGLRSEPSRYLPPSGRWPANVLLDEDAAAALDAQSGTLTSNSGEPFTRNTDKFRATYSAFAGRDAEAGYYGDSGGASRFYYTAKASRSEREEGLGGAARRPGGAHRHGQGSIGSKDGRDRQVANHHPTVKPVALMRWLVRLVTPPNGLVLDPFCGSGTTGIACHYEDRRFIGIEVSEEYAAIARARIAHHSAQRGLFDVA